MPDAAVANLAGMIAQIGPSGSPARIPVTRSQQTTAENIFGASVSLATFVPRQQLSQVGGPCRFHRSGG